MPRPLIALLTDFGLQDHYVGTMKGVALGICPDITFVDITHDCPPQDLQTGALELVAAYPHFPPGTIFLVVVDPGVGTSRRAIAVSAGPYTFVAPDNGVAWPALERAGLSAAVQIREPRFARPTISPTFEGRDRFAPAAAWLSTGVALSSLGPPAGPIRHFDLPRPRISTDAIDGEVVRVDRFGNLITNIDRTAADTFARTRALSVQVGNHCAGACVECYADVIPGALCALYGSTGALEIAVNGGSAAERLGLTRGAAVRVVRGT